MTPLERLARTPMAALEFANVVLTDYTKPDAIQVLEQLAQRGVSGVRINAPVRSPGDDPFAIWKAAARLGLSITSGGQSADFERPPRCGRLASREAFPGGRRP